MICCFISRYFTSGIMKCYISGAIYKIVIFWNSNCYICANMRKNCYFLKLKLLQLWEYLQNCYFFTESAAFHGRSTNLLLGQIWALGHGTLQSALSQQWMNELSWFFTCSYIVRKAKSYSGWTWSWLWLFRSKVSKISFISRINWWTELIFACWKWFHNFWSDS